MIRVRRLFALLLCGAFAVTLSPELTEGGPPPAGTKRKKTVKRPHPGKTLIHAYRALAKGTNSYKVDISIVGGLSDNPQHTVTQANVRETYSGDVFRSKLMHVPALKAYRTPTKGVGFFNGTWKNVLQDPKGRLMDRLFAFPEIVLSRAARYARTARWVEPAEGIAGDEKGKKKAKADEDDSDPVSRGKTVVVGNAEKGDEAMPRVIRVSAPTKEALNHFIEVENSGCFSGG